MQIVWRTGNDLYGPSNKENCTSNGATCDVGLELGPDLWPQDTYTGRWRIDKPLLTFIDTVRLGMDSPVPLQSIWLANLTDKDYSFVLANLTLLFGRGDVDFFATLTCDGGVCQQGSDCCRQQCWAWLFVQIGLSLLLIPQSFCWKSYFHGKRKNDRLEQEQNDLAEEVSTRLSKKFTLRDLRKIAPTELRPLTEQRKWFHDMQRERPVFLTHVRTLENFVKSGAPTDDRSTSAGKGNGVEPPPNSDEAGLSECWSGGTSRSTLYHYILFSDALWPGLLQSLWLAFFSGSLATFFYLLMSWQAYQYDSELPPVSARTFSKSFIFVRDSLNSMISSFKFFPNFLLVGYLGYTVSRWRGFLSTAYSIQGRIHDLANIVGGALCEPSSAASRAFAFRVYRYLQLVHILCYQPRDPRLKCTNLDNYVELGLLTKDEKLILEPAATKQRELVLAWLSAELWSAAKQKIVHDKTPVHGVRVVTELRGKTAAFHDAFVLNHPNVWAALMRFVVDTLVVMYAVSSSVTSFVFELGCFQVFCVAFTFLVTIPFICSSMIIEYLTDPFESPHDLFQLDALMVNTELQTFTALRVQFSGFERLQKND